MSATTGSGHAVAGPLELLIIQPTPFCNLDCDYCYLPDRNLTARISRQVLERAFEAALASPWVGDSISVVWHAGEPLVVPIAFYEDATELLARINRGGVRVRQCIQTNGTLLDSGWCDFFRRNDVRIGVSVDGPAFLHDARRHTRHGKGTHEAVMRGIRCLQEHDLPFYVITVLTLASLEHADELFTFYLDNGIREVAFNVEESEGANRGSSLDVLDAQARLEVFLRRFLDLVEEKQAQPLLIREVAGFAAFVASEAPFLEGNQENTPFRILSVDWQGRFSTFSPEMLGLRSEEFGDFVLGTVLSDDLAALTRTPHYERMWSDIRSGIAACKNECEYFGVCGGGSPVNKYSENGRFDSTETLHCRLTKKAFTNVLLERLEKKARENGLVPPPEQVRPQPAWRSRLRSAVGRYLTR